LNKVNGQLLKRFKEQMGKYPTDAAFIEAYQERQMSKKWEVYKEKLMEDLLAEIKIKKSKNKNHGQVLARDM
jgi:hypothetical protein